MALTPEEIDGWTRKWTRVWNPREICDTLHRANGHVVFIAVLPYSLKLHLGIDREGINLCGLWRGEECVLWDRRIGFCTTPGPIPAPPAAILAPFEAYARLLIRRNCFLLGAPIVASEEEEREWRQNLRRNDFTMRPPPH